MKPAPHAVCDAASRNEKARRIHSALETLGLSKDSKVLDVGTGSGHIASFIGSKLSVDENLVSVDVVDLRVIKSNYVWTSVKDATLPFENASFDFVISNHVLEHLASKKEQKTHAQEIFRVLRPGGTLYLSVPNKWFFWEHHFNLPFLSWFPRRTASALVRAFRRGEWYDCRPLSRGQLEQLLRNAGFNLSSAASRMATFGLGFDYSRLLPTRLGALSKAISSVVLPTLAVFAQKMESLDQ